MKFLYNNLIKSAQLYPSSENAQYPASNLKDDRRTKSFRSTSNTTTIVLDFGLVRDVDALTIVDNGINGLGFVSATLELNSTNVWTSPAYSAALTVNETFGYAFHIPATLQSYRYARLTLVNTAGYCEIGKLFIGKSEQLGELSFSYPIAFQFNNNSIVTKNRRGQKFFDEIGMQKEISGSINTATIDEIEPLLDLLKFASFDKPIWLHFPDGNITNDNARINGYYYLKDDPSLSFVAGNFWNTSLSFEEAQ